MTAALASPWADSARADFAQVAVVLPGGGERPLTLEALAGSEDVVARPYLLRGPEGETTRTLTGFSLAALLEAAGADPYGFTYLEVPRPAGGSVLLSRDQALDGGADGPPVVYATASGTGFLRPSEGEDDLNAADSFEAPQGISVVLCKGAPLLVRAEATPLRTRPGESVDFRAVVEQSGAGESLAVSWYFDDGHSAKGESARHSFARPGSYDVVLGVTSKGEGAGASDVVTVQVGEPAAGPDRKGGGRNDEVNAPDHGGAAGPSTGTGGGAPASAPEGAGTESALPAGGDVETKPPAAAPAHNPRSHSRFEMHANRAKGTTDSAQGQRVFGEVLSPSGQSTSTHPAKQATARRGRLEETGGEVPAAAWGALATLGLLGAGALLEARQLGASLRPRLSRKGAA